MDIVKVINLGQSVRGDFKGQACKTGAMVHSAC